LLDFFIVCFWVGLILTIVVTIFGDFFSHWFDFAGTDSTAHGGGSPSPFNLTTILGFTAAFGGTGYILTTMGIVGGALTLIIAAVAGLVVASGLFVFLSKVLMRQDDVMQELDYQLVGMLGTVSIPVPPEGVGELKYEQNGTIRSIGIKSQDGQPIERGVKTIIMSVEKGIATVCKFEEEILISKKEV
jgi:membrane protein implicated in regulation of membrane protease activity